MNVSLFYQHHKKLGHYLLYIFIYWHACMYVCVCACNFQYVCLCASTKESQYRAANTTWAEGFCLFVCLPDRWELNTGPLQDQQALLNTKPSVLSLLLNFQHISLLKRINAELPKYVSVEQIKFKAPSTILLYTYHLILQ